MFLVLVTSNLIPYYSVLLTRMKRIFFQVLIEVENFAMKFFFWDERYQFFFSGENVAALLSNTRSILHIEF